MSNVENYNIAWISTAATDYIAARAFLDEEHPALLSPRGKFDYTLGRIGSHNVVLISSLFQLKHDASLAAFIAQEMLHNFPNIRIGLMVGTGGGAPSKNHDIRFGDIVVGVPCNGRSGVLQYDFDQTIETQSCQPTGYLDQPPTVFRTAIAETKAQYENKGHNLDSEVRKILDKRPRLRKKYQRPDLATDRLYRSHIVHPQDNGSPCALSCGEDSSCLVVRRPRLECDGIPAIHYGLIASAHRLMNNASIRDKLADQMDILCFETEAAGLMNHYPFLVIRGICGYADSHNNEDWKGHAAMLAAAYAQDLLSRIPARLVEQEAKVISVLNGENHTGRIEFSGLNHGIQVGLNGDNYTGRIEFSGLNHAIQVQRNDGLESNGLGEVGGAEPIDSAFFVSSNIRGRPPVSMEGPKQGSTS